ncbi:hypothetical protein DAMNIGENAA_07040 [Desulforhabdus amnigena]|uniref:Uncharacterized protein n=1 Tax=Desulforhabdus amnigena TaxID=40218 RepID=A0A9W6CWR5_9BACT|nr:hypothetical protein DAMNIGENAA_07040 [Desulforhabdus amnigena]
MPLPAGDPALSDRPISHCTARVEIWFSILVRKLLKRASFLSTNDLKEKLPAFIDYFNRTMAKPFKWTCKGKALSA